MFLIVSNLFELLTMSIKFIENFLHVNVLSSYRAKKTEDKKDRGVLIVFLSVLITLLVAP